MIRRGLALACAAGAMGGAVAVAALGVRAARPMTTNAAAADPTRAHAGAGTFAEAAKKKPKKKPPKKVVKKPTCATTTAATFKAEAAKKKTTKKKPKPKPKPKAKPVKCPAPSPPAAAAPSPPPVSPPPPPSAPSPAPPPSPPPPSGEVHIADNDGGVALHAVSGGRPGQTEDRCIRVTYDGSLSADVRMYLSGSAGALAPHLDLIVTPGTAPPSAFPGCDGYSATGTDVFAGTLTQFATHTSWASGLAVPAPGDDRWQNGDTMVFRVRVTLADANAANGAGAGPLTAGPYGVVWEARDE